MDRSTLKPSIPVRIILLMIACIVGAGLMVAAARLSPENQFVIWGLWIMQALLCSPFSLKTARGRLWWLSFTLVLACAVTASRIGLNHPLSSLCAVVGGWAVTATVGLRWNLFGIKD